MSWLGFLFLRGPLIFSLLKFKYWFLFPSYASFPNSCCGCLQAQSFPPALPLRQVWTCTPFLDPFLSSWGRKIRIIWRKDQRRYRGGIEAWDSAWSWSRHCRSPLVALQAGFGVPVQWLCPGRPVVAAGGWGVMKSHLVVHLFDFAAASQSSTYLCCSKPGGVLTISFGLLYLFKQLRLWLVS